MVTQSFAPKWTPLGLAQRARNVLERPSDVLLALRIGYFVLTTPARLERIPLPEFLDRLRARRRPRAATVPAAVRRIERLRQPWLRLTPLAERNTCYVRALTLYRFLDPCGGALRIHFGVAPGDDPADRLSGHAWITVDGTLYEAPDPVVAGRVREIYAHPGTT